MVKNGHDTRTAGDFVESNILTLSFFLIGDPNIQSPSLLKRTYATDHIKPFEAVYGFNDSTILKGWLTFVQRISKFKTWIPDSKQQE